MSKQCWSNCCHGCSRQSEAEMIKLKFDTVTVVSRHCRDICRYLRCFRQSGAGVIELKLGTVTPRHCQPMSCMFQTVRSWNNWAEVWQHCIKTLLKYLLMSWVFQTIRGWNDWTEVWHCYVKSLQRYFLMSWVFQTVRGWSDWIEVGHCYTKTLPTSIPDSDSQGLEWLSWSLTSYIKTLLEYLLMSLIFQAVMELEWLRWSLTSYVKTLQRYWLMSWVFMAD